MFEPNVLYERAQHDFVRIRFIRTQHLVAFPLFGPQNQNSFMQELKSVK